MELRACFPSLIGWNIKAALVKYALQGKADTGSKESSNYFTSKRIVLPGVLSSAGRSKLDATFLEMPAVMPFLSIGRGHVLYTQWASCSFIQTSEEKGCITGSYSGLSVSWRSATILVQTLEGGFVMMFFGQGEKNMGPPPKTVAHGV